MNPLRIICLCCVHLVVCVPLTWRANADEVKELLKQLKNRDISERQAALRELNMLGAESAAGVPLLVSALSDDNEEIRQIVTAVLGKIGKPAVPALAQALKNDGVLVRRQALLALSRVGRDGKEAVPAVVAAVKDDSKDVRSFAVAALLKIDPEGPAILPALKQTLQDADKGVRIGAVYTLEDLARKEMSAHPLLLETLKNRDWEVRLAGAATLTRLGTNIKGAAAELKAALKDEDARVRNSVALALATVVPKQADSVVDVLIRNLGDKDGDVRRGAAYVLGEVGEGAKAAEPALRAALDDTRPEVRRAASQALERIGGKK